MPNNNYKNSSESDDSDLQSFFDKQWNMNLQKMTTALEPLAQKLGENNIKFTPETDIFYTNTQKETDEICKDVLKDKNNLSTNYYGCTEQNKWEGKYNEPYERPFSTTYLAKEWDKEFVDHAMWHELQHLAIITIRQSIEKSFKSKLKLNKNYIYFNDFISTYYKWLMKQFNELDKKLDLNDKAKINPSTKKIIIYNKSDVLPGLTKIVDQFLLEFGWLI